MHVHVHACMCTHACARMRINVHACARMRINVHACARMCTHTHACMHVCMRATTEAIGPPYRPTLQAHPLRRHSRR